ncbi:TonB-dependent receptor [Rheinheimera sp. MMS21-TC3]|uniref:TonB-dependent receptor n=1 Tax=Rheinheimera sp. MMS21-TC3 TaxID=3072790 RepID=UPI0028C3B00D|nr:TonB-dependent receptor [Rheinheimera sp. MMS21-TC3]WNO61972.1 TonB-dependent receptor [Rheinheimera sp. MMS21-TC3]
MYMNNKLSKAVRLAIIFGAASATAFATSVNAAEEEAAKKVERIEVTGSRLSRADMEGSLPVVVFDRATIEASGDISVSDFLRETNFNSFGSYQSSSGSSWGGFSGISLRGLGESRTLILVDGRRAPTSPMVGAAQDLNSIPLAAVERVEVLSAGASAIYGSDALGGVVNIITRKDFDGVQLTYGLGKPTNDGGDTEEGSILIGASSAKSRVLAGASFNSRDIIYTRDRDYWYAAPGGSVYSNNFSTSTSTAVSSRLAHPTYGTAVPGLCTNGDDSDLFYMNTANGTCQFNHSATSANLTSSKNFSVFGNASYDINDDWSMFFNSSVAKSETRGRYAPVPSSPFPGGAIAIPKGTPNHPATSPTDGGLNPEWNDPYYQTLADTDLFLFHRFAALGNRDSFSETTTHSFSGGIEGTLGIVDVDAGVRYIQSRATDMGYNYVVGGLAQIPITQGKYNIYDPFSGDPKGLGFTTTILRDMKTSIKEFYLNGSVDMFEMSGGTAALSMGVEYREEFYQDNYDPLSESGQVVGSAGNSSAGSRDITALYGEVLFPLLDKLELSVAGRYDKYSDYGSDFSPMASLRFQPIDSLTLRATYGEGFRAPTLNALNSKPSFSAAFTNDRQTCEMAMGVPACSVQVTSWGISNPNLESEKSKQYGLGLAWAATDWLNMTADYYSIKITNQISTIGVDTVIGCYRGSVENCPPGISLFPVGTSAGGAQSNLGLGVELDPATGGIVFVQTGSGNLGFTKTSGVDLALNTNFDLEEYGQLRSTLNASYVTNYSGTNGVNIAGREGLPKLRGSLNTTWSISDFSVVWNMSYIHTTESIVYRDWLTDPAGQTFEEYSEGLQGKKLTSYLTHNLQVNYNTGWDATITVGVKNLTDRDPTYDRLYQNYGSDTVNTELYDPWGRVPYVRYTQRF